MSRATRKPLLAALCLLATLMASGCATRPAEPIARPGASAELQNTYWKLTELDGARVPMAPGQQREARITLASGGSRLTGFSGCNPLMGAYVHEGGSMLRLTPLATTRMACAPPLMALETRLLKALEATTAYRIEGEQLTLLDDARALARFDAVYLH